MTNVVQLHDICRAIKSITFLQYYINILTRNKL